MKNKNHNYYKNTKTTEQLKVTTKQFTMLSLLTEDILTNINDYVELH